MPFDFDDLDDLPPLPDALAKQLGISVGLGGFDLDLEGSSKTAKKGGPALAKKGKAAKPKTAGTRGRKRASLDDEALLARTALDDDMDSAAARGEEEEEEEDIDDDDDDDLIGSLGALPPDGLRLPFGDLDDDDDGDPLLPPFSPRTGGGRGVAGGKGGSGSSTAGGGRGARSTKRGPVGVGEEGLVEDDDAELDDALSSGVPTPSELNLDDNDEDSALDVDGGDDGDDDGDDLDDVDAELLDDDDDDADSAASSARRRRRLFGSGGGEEDDDSAAELDVDGDVEEVKLLSVFEDELSVDAAGNLVDGMGNLWGGATFAEASKSLDEPEFMSEEQLEDVLGNFLLESPGWKRGEVVAFLHSSLEEEEELLEVNDEPADPEDENYEDAAPLDAKAEQFME